MIIGFSWIDAKASKASPETKLDIVAGGVLDLCLPEPQASEVKQRDAYIEIARARAAEFLHRRSDTSAQAFDSWDVGCCANIPCHEFQGHGIDPADGEDKD